MDWKDIGGIVGKAAPILGGLLAIPTGGASVAIGQAIAAALGTDATPDAVAHAIQNDPQAAVKLQELNNQHKQIMAKIEADERIANASQAANEAIAVDNNTTQRWLSDNTAGGLPALTRPLLVWFCVFFTAILATTDGNIGGFTIKPVYVDIFNQLTVGSVLAYMGLRTYEKYKGVHNDDGRKL